MKSPMDDIFDTIAAKIEDFDFLNDHEGRVLHVLGYNEPDQYGPACVGEWVDRQQ